MKIKSLQKTVNFKDLEVGDTFRRNNCKESIYLKIEAGYATAASGKFSDKIEIVELNAVNLTTNEIAIFADNDVCIKVNGEFVETR